MASEQINPSPESLQRSIEDLRRQLDELRHTLQHTAQSVASELQRQNEAHQASRASDIFVLQLLFSYDPALRVHFADTIDKFLNTDFVIANPFLHGEMKTIKALAKVTGQPPENGLPDWFQGIIRGGKKGKEEDS